MCQVKVGRLLLARADRRTRVSKGLSPLARMQGRVAHADGSITSIGLKSGHKVLWMFGRAAPPRA